MKKFILLSLLFTGVIFTTRLNAQACGNSGPAICTPMGGITQPGFYPPDDSLPCAVVAVPFDQTVDVHTPATAQGYTINWIHINHIINLPCGLCWASGAANDRINGNSTGCVRVRGTTYDAPGEYKMGIYIDVNVTVFGFPTTISNLRLDSVYPSLRYYLRVQLPGGTCAPVDTLNPGLNAHSGGTVSPLPTVSGTNTICPGGSTTLTAGTGAYYGYVWSTGEITQAITVNAAGTYTVTVYENCASATASRTVTVVNPNPTLNVTGSTTFCAGGSVTLDAGAGYATYTWSNGATTQTISPTTSGSYTASVTQGTCSGTSNTVAVTVNSNPTPTVTPNGPTTFCAGGSVTLDAGAGYSSYIWSNTIAAQTTTVNTTGSYIVTVTDANNCTGASTPVQVTVNPAATATIAPATANICNGDVIVLTAGGGTSYIWSNSATTAAITISPNTSINYDVTVTDANTCTGSASRMVNVTTVAPNVTANGPTTFCTGGSVMLDAGAGYTGYSWSSGETTQTINVTASGNYTVTATLNGCSGTSNTITVTVTGSTLSPVITGSPSLNICPGGSSTLDAGSGYDTYSWSTTATTEFISTNVANTYTVTVTQGACSGTAAATVIVSNFPVAVNITPAGPVTACAGTPVNLDAGAGFDSYSWSSGETTQTIQPTGSASYVVMVTQNFCTGMDTVDVTINSLPSASISPASPAICRGTNTILTASGGNGYVWSTLDLTPSINVSPTSNTTYSVTVTDANSCTATASAMVTVNNNPIATVSPSTPAICRGDSTPLLASGGSAYAWSDGETVAMINVSPGNNTTYTVTVSDNNSCTASASSAVTVNATPTASVSPPSVSVCNGSSTTLTASGGGGYLWSDGETTATITIAPTVNVTYMVTVTGNNNCSAAVTDSVTVNVVPTATITNLGSAFGYALLQANPAGATYQWLFQANQTDAYTNTGISTQLDTVPCSGTATYYTVVVTQNNCSDSSAQYAAICTGIEEISSLVHFSIQPNPASDVLNVSYELNNATAVHLSVVDLTGRRVIDVLNESQNRGKHLNQIRLNEISAGIYLLNFMTDSGSFNSKFVKQ